jgi:glycosyltransferase involved in cell wall biosynthesis
LYFSVIIPAYNEQSLLEGTIKSLLDSIDSIAGDRRWEVLVVDNNSSDQTASIAKRLGCKVCFEPIRSIAKARNHGARLAMGKYLLFLDADTHVPALTLRQAVQLITKKKMGYVGAKLCFDQDHGRFISGRLIPAFWNLISRIFGLFAGSFVFCRKDLFEFCGGFPEDFYAGEEIVLAKKMKKKCKSLGWSSRIMPKHFVVSSARKLAWYKDFDLLRMLLPLVLSNQSLQNQSRCAFWYKRPEKVCSQ